MASMLTISEAHPAPPCSIVILGASGDLARRKLLPALYNLEYCGAGLVPAQTAIVGFARTRMTAEDFRRLAREAVNEHSRLSGEAGCLRRFEERLNYLPGLDLPDGFERLRHLLEETERRRGLPPNRIFYLSIPPEAIRESVERLSAAGLISARGQSRFTRVVVEKPIGHDLAGAIEISETLHHVLDESQIFRIDHYLGKEVVQNLFVLRFANAIFERLWGARNIDHVQITVAESEGVGRRAGYYDPSGALRDMVQNHMLQLLALIATEPPVSLEAAAVREAKLNVLRAIRPIGARETRRLTVRGRYTAGTIDGARVAGYLEEKGVPPDSTTETYVALKMFVDNWRWSGVPFYLRTGKRLNRRESFIAVQFKDAPKILFNSNGNLPSNVLTLRIQPDEGFSFGVMAKRPGLDLKMSPVRMDLRYAGAFDGPSPDAYERLLLDVMAGDHTLFPSDAFVHKSWEFVQTILDSWSAGAPAPLYDYPAGSWGPASADELIAADGHSWINPEPTPGPAAAPR
jgi:glucose-6-phosphate 1-dehydrogenase